MTHDDDWTEEDLAEAITSTADFAPEFQGLALWLGREVSGLAYWPGARFSEKFAWSQLVAWLRHNVTSYDQMGAGSGDDQASLERESEELRLHRKTCPHCNTNASCEVEDSLIEEEVFQMQVRQGALRKEANQEEARKILQQHRDPDAHPDNCALCDLWHRTTEGVGG